MHLRLVLFGSPTIEHDGATAALPFERRGQLAAFLALKRGWVPRAELATLLWPEQPAKLAYTNLRKTLFRLHSLPWRPALDLQEGAIRLAAATDVAAFEDALRDGREADAIALRRGELLAGFDDDANEAWTAWLRFERDRLRLLWRVAVLARLDAATEAVAALDLSARLLEADLLDEAAARAQITWLARSGQVARAREVYDAFARRLGEELGLVPGVDLERLGASLDAPPAASPVARPVAPPSRDEGFVGRAIELRAIAERLCSGQCRLLTLVGPGGVGKTRLARRVLDELQAGFVDGGVFVALDDVAMPEEIGLRLARELGVRPRGADAMGAVVDALRERQQLLVVDNCEQVASGAAQLQRMVDGCPRLTIIATSRVRLGLPGEWVLPVDGLPCPEAEDHDRIEAFDAARLFVQSARRVQPAFDVAAESPAIVDICRQVEGLPLALELAASWTRVLSCEAIASELRHGTELLRAVDGSRSARHGSFDVVFDQSWQFLRPSEREALARLSVFRGGFSPAAARAVCSASLPVLGALIDKSLLRKEGARITMHPLVQQLAAERVDGEATRLATATAHARHFHQLVARSSLDTRNGDRHALDAIDQDFANFRTAWHHAAEHGAADLLRASLRATLDFCDHRGRAAEGLTMFRDALGSPATMCDPGLDPRLRSVIAHLESRLDRHADAQATARAALAMQPGSEDVDTRLQCLTVLGTCALRAGDYDAARRHYREVLEIAPPEHYPHNGAAVLVNLAVIEKSLGDFDAALTLFVRALHQYRQLGDLGGQALCHNNLGDLYLERDEPAVAAPYLREGLALCEGHGFAYTRMLILANLADVALREHDDAAAERHARLALQAAKETGNRAVACVAWITLARVALRRGDAAAARALLGAAAGEANATGEPTLQLAAVLCWADVIAAAGDVPSAYWVLAAVSEHPQASEGQRREARRRFGVHDVPKDAAPQGFDLAALVQRIESESASAHAPLVAALRGAR